MADMREGLGAYRVLEEKPGVKRHRWDDNIKLNLKEMWWEGVFRLIWLGTGTGLLAMMINLQVP